MISEKQKEPELCNIYKQEMLKSNFFNKNLKNNQTFSKKEYNFLMPFLNIYTGIAYFICTTYISFIHKVWVNLINQRQQETHGLLGKKIEFHGINLLRGKSVHPKKYNHLNPTQLLDLCCSVL